MKNKFEIRGEVTAIKLHRRDGTEIETIISTTDLKKANEFPGTWYANRSKEGMNSFYVCGNLKTGDKKLKVRLHRWLLDAPKGLEVDHIDRQPLNNQRENLRIVTTSQNLQNRSVYKTSKSGVRGVYWVERIRKWAARVAFNGKILNLGYFSNIKEAEMVVKKARKENMPFSTEE